VWRDQGPPLAGTEVAENKPRIWVLQGPRAGDNAQARALGSLAGGTVRLIELRYNWTAKVPSVLMGSTLTALDATSRKQLVQPWPDIIIGVGRRMAPVILAVKALSGNKTRAVCIGRPRMPLSAFDLVVTTPQYALPKCDNVIELPLPLQAAEPASAEDRAKIERLWLHFPRPWIVAAIGGQKFPLCLGSQELTAYGRNLSALATQSGGSIMLFSSPRTSHDGLNVVAAAAGKEAWRADQEADGSKLYRAAREAADMLAVTSDSVSMIAEMCATGKPVYVERLPVSNWRVSWSTTHGLTRWLSASGVIQPPRNVPALVDGLINSGIVHDLTRGETTSRLPHRAVNPDAICARLQMFSAE
jgi:uncharacterized protein